MGQIWKQYGQAHVGNICKCPYGSNLGTIWANPCGNHYVSAHMIIKIKGAKTKSMWETYVNAHGYGSRMGPTWADPCGKQM